QRIPADPRAAARAAVPPAKREQLAEACYTLNLYRSHCEVADQWSFIEAAEALTQARERLPEPPATSGPAPPRGQRTGARLLGGATPADVRLRRVRGYRPGVRNRRWRRL